MEILNEDIAIGQNLETQPSSNGIVDYARTLCDVGVEFREDGGHLIIGAGVSAENRWVIYISLVIYQIEAALRHLLPHLLKENVSIRIPKDSSVANRYLNGNHGYLSIGKVIEITLTHHENAFASIDRLIEATQSYRGPRIPGTLHLGGTLYTTPDNKILKERYYKEVEYDPFVNYSRVKIISQMHDKAKGSLYKGIYYKGRIPQGYCVVKQGNMGMCSDLNGREVCDRILWQQEIHNKLKGKVNIPGIIDCFEHAGNIYLVMEFVDGKDLSTHITEIRHGRLWSGLKKKEKLKILDLLVDAVRAVDVLHKNGVVHRDLSPINFIRTKAGEVSLIDLELSYDLELNRPFPLFSDGTAGFIAPEYYKKALPTVKQDIYALGALILNAILWILPSRFDMKDKAQLAKQLQFFIQDHDMVQMILNCIDQNPNGRPSLAEIEHSLVGYNERLKNESPKESSHIKSVDLQDLDRAIHLSLDRLLDSERSSIYDLTALRKIADMRISAEPTVYANGVGCASGITGLLVLQKYFEKQLNKVMQHKIARAFEDIPDFLFAYKPTWGVSLLSGSSGLQLSLILAEHSNILSGQKHQHLGVLTNMAAPAGPYPDLGIMGGIAGYGLASLMSEELTPGSYGAERAHYIADQLIHLQQPDGSWEVKEANGQSFDLSLGNGVMGILYFLLKYYVNRQEDTIKATIIKGLQWVSHVKQKQNRLKLSSIWRGRPAMQSMGLLDGNAGLACVYLMAYRMMGNCTYKKQAIDLLEQVPISYFIDSFGLAQGLAGNGIAYCFATEILGDRSWLCRASYIVNLLLHTQQDDTWITSGQEDYDTSLLTGQTGILCFLMYYKSLQNQ